MEINVKVQNHPHELTSAPKTEKGKMIELVKVQNLLLNAAKFVEKRRRELHLPLKQADEFTGCIYNHYINKKYLILVQEIIKYV